MLLAFTPPKDSSPKLIEIIMDNYLANSIKESTRQKRGDGQRVFITGLGQTMPQGVNWQSLLSNNENKTDLIHCFVEYLKQPAVRSIFKVPIIITEKDRTWKIDSTGIQELQSCNHEEADTRLALHATHHNHNCVITSKDTGVFLLLVYAYHKSSSNKIWYMKHEPNKFINIGKVCAYLGGTISEHLLKFHAMTGCDTTSYFYRVGKIRVMKQFLKDQSTLQLIESLGKEQSLPAIDLDNCQRFIQTVMYNGKENESYVQTRVKMYQKQNVKTSLTLPLIKIRVFKQLKELIIKLIYG